MLLEQRRFNRRAAEDLRNDAIGDATLGEYLERLGASEYFSRHYLVPIAAAVWSSPDEDMLRFPARAFIRFFANHGMLALRHRPTWQTVVGGSQAYVRAFRSKFQGAIRTNSPVTAIARSTDGVMVRTNGNTEVFDRVVLATHADESLALVTDASPGETNLLSAWKYHRNPVLLHTDASVLPKDRRLWASWNYCRKSGAPSTGPLQVTYYMNRLQGLKSERDYFVSLNASAIVDPSSIIYSIEYAHPGYSSSSFAAQTGLRSLNGTNLTYYCGSYMGYGFHEDAVASSVDVAARLGVSL
jgi:predicted NAD/FAD-binding protein